ncbi:gp03 [Alphaproteobacteria phage PhiJL001]|uniref:Gp03 n=1 Tax=Alphaproteobacteria phage PhiJL001 TaxID=2681607 RepID=Q5DNA2_9CAUD|nr:gp03 [Alphaproteobacteria phage PhiJL001]AAT69461.1 gp03 [Alphaproteobacteria phage PhiJL001]
MALTPRQYQNLSNNLAEVLRYVKQADSQLDYYRRELGQ